MSWRRSWAWAGALLLGATAARADLSFSQPLDYPVDGQPSSLASADFDGVDGLDLVTGTGSGRVALLLNNGDGTFREGGAVAVPSGLPSVLAMDLDGVNGPDVATGNFRSRSVSVLLNAGDGTFRPPDTYPVGTLPALVEGIAGADFDGVDGPDLAVTNVSFQVVGANEVSVLLNNGDGTFSPAVTYPLGVRGPHSITAADLDGRNGPDLAVSNRDQGSVFVFFNRGDGTFGPPRILTAPGAPTRVIAADLDGVDGPDLATINFFDSVNVFLNRGNGTFTRAVRHVVGGGGASLSAADFDGDRDLDLVAASFESDGLSVLPNAGDGTFLPFVAVPVGHATEQVVAAELDGVDGPDLAVTDAEPSLSNVSVLLNETPPPPELACGSTVTSNVQLTRDLDCDGDGLEVEASGVTIDLNGFTLSGNGGGIGIYIEDPYSEVTIRNGVVRGFSVGILIEGETSDRHSIIGNRIHDCGRAIDVFSDAGAGVVDNEIFDNFFGIDTSQAAVGLFGNHFHDNEIGAFLRQVEDVGVVDNRFSGHRIGVWVLFESDPRMTGNRFEHNLIGVQIGASDPDDSLDITHRMSDNVFASNGATGILILNADQLGTGSRIDQNEFRENGFAPQDVTNNAGAPVDDGIHVEGGPAPNLTLSANRVVGNADYGIEAPGVVDGGGNVAMDNGNPDQCVGVVCRVVAPGDLDGDGDVDLDDLRLLLQRLNEPASGPSDPADLDGDGRITGLDARKLVLSCTRPRCATE